ncbi:MAG: SUMF1/EgtB/PvdO family nonheme iron enzyme [Anaerolineae bacterium]
MSDSSIAPILDDLPTGVDALDFTPYVEALSEILLDANTGTPLTLGVFGSWGSGKTSLMRMLHDRVKSTHCAVWFNAWKYNQEDALWRALLLVLLDKLEEAIRPAPAEPDKPARGKGKDAPGKDAAAPPEDEPDTARLIELLREALYRETTWTEKGAFKPDGILQAVAAGLGLGFNLFLSGTPLGVVKEVVEAAQKKFGEGEPVSQMAKLAQALKREEVIHTQAQLKSLEQFQENFARLVARLPGAKRRLIVFVDDLDRCTPEKALQVLEALKLFLDVPNCIFVLGLDQTAIETAVRTRYRDEVKARDYLEKIIQLPFTLPPLEDEVMLKYVKSLAQALPDERCAQVFAQGMQPNPRQVKRTLNFYLLLMRLVEKRAPLTATPLRLAKMVAIQHGHPDLYALLSVYPHYLPELETYFRAEDAAGRGDMAGREKPALPEDLQKFVGEAVRRLLSLYLDDAEACFGGLERQDVRSYITLTRRAAPELATVRRARLPFEPELVAIPTGAFLMGTSEEQAAALKKKYKWAKALNFEDEHPQHTVTLQAFEIGKYPVTNAEYAEFVKATGYRAPEHWRNGVLPEDLADHPVVYVTWRDALAYVTWLREATGQPYRLPTEAEWEKAARGTEGRLWPWGDEWDPHRCNLKPAGPGATTPVGRYSPRGDSFYGCADMAGNVWEWCSSLYQPYPYQADDGREDLEADGTRVLRGGSWYNDNPASARCAFRAWIGPDYWSVDSGFRVARGSL